jgi:hypothetical protein
MVNKSQGLAWRGFDGAMVLRNITHAGDGYVSPCPQPAENAWLLRIIRTEGLAKISSFSASGGQRASPFGNPSWVRHVTPQVVYGSKAFLIIAKGSNLIH